MNHRSEHTDSLIHGYTLELSEPPCIPGADTWNAKAILEDSIAPVLPYLIHTRKTGSSYCVSSVSLEAAEVSEQTRCPFLLIPMHFLGRPGR